MDINKIITTNFNDNIEYFQENKPLLFEKLTALESAISNNYYIQKYELVFENNSFDVKELKTDNYLYNKESKTHTKLSTKSVDFSILDNTFELFQRVTLSKEEISNFKNQDPILDNRAGLDPLIHLTTQLHSPKENLKHLDKYVFFGTGLSLHIQEIHKKIAAKIYLIVEDDLELFRLSLFTHNYKTLATQSELFFSIFEDKKEFATTAQKFLDHKYYYNHYIKYFELLSHSIDKRELFYQQINTQAHNSFFYNKLLIQFTQPFNYIFDSYSFTHKNLDLLHSPCKNSPFLLLGAGPSLEKNISWLKQNHNNFIIVAVSATLSLLEKEKIHVDIITHLDAFEVSEVHFKNIKNINYFRDSICLFSARTTPNIVNYFKKENIYFFENATKYLENSMKPSAPCVGSISHQILLVIQVQKMYLLGLDLALDSQTGMTHSTHHPKAQQLRLDKSYNTKDYARSIIYVDGNKIPTVPTTEQYKASIETINLSSKLLKQKSQCILNLGEGAKFIDTEAAYTDTQQLSNLDINTKKVLRNIFTKHSFSKPSEQDLELLKKRQTYIHNLKATILEYSSMKVQSTEKFLISLESFLILFHKHHDTNNYEIYKVLDLYFHNITSYIFDYFNTCEKLQPDNTALISTLFYKHTLELIDYYDKSLSTKITH